MVFIAHWMLALNSIHCFFFMLSNMLGLVQKMSVSGGSQWQQQNGHLKSPVLTPGSTVIPSVPAVCRTSSSLPFVASLLGLVLSLVLRIKDFLQHYVLDLSLAEWHASWDGCCAEIKTHKVDINFRVFRNLETKEKVLHVKTVINKILFLISNHGHVQVVVSRTPPPLALHKEQRSSCSGKCMVLCQLLLLAEPF